MRVQYCRDVGNSMCRVYSRDGMRDINSSEHRGLMTDLTVLTDLAETVPIIPGFYRKLITGMREYPTFRGASRGCNIP